MPTVVLLGTLDTKGAEHAWLRERLVRLGNAVILVDTGVLDEPQTVADVPREEVARAAGTTLAELRAQGDRGVAVAAMARGAARIVTRLYEEGRLHGVASVGGSGNSSISAAAMRALPLGVPKLLVSSMASGDVSPYVGGSDLTLMYTVVDVAGLNRVSLPILANAADAISGMAAGFAAGRPAPPDDRPLIGATMAGVTTPGVRAAARRLADLGYETLVFHATGAGGRSFEEMTGGGAFAGVLDATLLELSTELVGGVGAPVRTGCAARAATACRRW